MLPALIARRIQGSCALLLLGALCIFPGPLSAGQPLRAPGDCSEEEHRLLKEEVGRACKATSMRCHEYQGCAELLANWLKYQRCISARVAIMDKCFRGGDENHRREVENYRSGAAECSRLMDLQRCPKQCR
jgi:putative RNase toxin 16 of polymorphic toxin system